MKKIVMMRKYTTGEVAVGAWLTGGVRRAGPGIEVQVERGVCLRDLIGDLWPPVNLPDPPKSHW